MRKYLGATLRSVIPVILAFVISAAFGVAGASAAKPGGGGGGGGGGATGGLPVSWSVNLFATGTPAGANDFRCRPSKAHPRPVVLVHGTFFNMANTWSAMSPYLKNNGYCVFALNYGGTSASLGAFYGLGPVAASAGELATFVDRVLSSTGAKKVDIVGWSQGGMMPRYYAKNLGGAAKVGTIVGLASSNHGTTLSGLASLAGLLPGAMDLVGSACASCSDQVEGSAFLTDLNAGGDTLPGIAYTVLATKFDEVVTPYQNAFLTGPGATNVTMQSGCALDLSDHVAMPYNSRAGRLVLNALDPATAKPIPCTPVLPLIGG